MTVFSVKSYYQPENHVAKKNIRQSWTIQPTCHSLSLAVNEILICPAQSAGLLKKIISSQKESNRISYVVHMDNAQRLYIWTKACWPKLVFHRYCTIRHYITPIGNNNLTCECTLNWSKRTSRTNLPTVPLNLCPRQLLITHDPRKSRTDFTQLYQNSIRE